MSDAIAAPAPVAPSSPAPSNGASGPTTPAASPKPSINNGAPRANNGQFLPKESNAGAIRPDAPQQPGETKAEAEERRYRGKAKVYGKEEAYDIGEKDIPRLHQKLRAHEMREQERRDIETKARRILELAQQDPEHFLKQLGKDPDELARKRLAHAARLGAMDENERKVYELEQQLARFKQDADSRQKQQAQAARDATQRQLAKQYENKFIPALDKAGIEPAHKALYLEEMARAERLALDEGYELSSEQAFMEASRRLDSMGMRLLKNLSGAALAKRLGPELVTSILETEIARAEREHSFDGGRTAAPEPTAPKEPEVLDEAEVNRRLRAMRQNR